MGAAANNAPFSVLYFLYLCTKLITHIINVYMNIKKTIKDNGWTLESLRAKMQKIDEANRKVIDYVLYNKKG